MPALSSALQQGYSPEMSPGIFAATSFVLFTGVGYSVQLLKLFQRRKAKIAGALPSELITEGLHPAREMWSFAAFLFFLLSGLTRSYTDFVLITTRIPVLLIATAIMWFLVRERPNETRKFWILTSVGNGLWIAVVILTLCGTVFGNTIFSRFVDVTLGLVTVLLFYGKTSQAFVMYKRRESRAVSWLREVGVVLKDLTGLWYAMSVGAALAVVASTHCLSAVASIAICIAKWSVERKKTKLLAA